jgi:hypothetical protein
MIGDTWVGLIVPPALVLFGTVLPKVGRLLGKNDRRFVLEHLHNTLAARIEEPESQFDTALRRGWLGDLTNAFVLPKALLLRRNPQSLHLPVEMAAL